ncbi:hypothetical protein SASPL_122237 [Salvia splendens]|uniref:Uncharacterized protein n=1 Tax=Salvia splendens TaxID=180675 RepID=A0A8X8XJM8_SALSN|nr:hypothetical protein SASPL_122237 [Salvia splendens]
MAFDQSKLDLSETSSDLPPESFYIPTGDEREWFDRNAVMQRKSSLKIGYHRNFKSLSQRSAAASHQKSSAPPLSALRKVHKTGNTPEKKPLFRSRSEPGGKAVVHETEPVSPRVSCTGRVRFKGGDGKKTGFSRIVSSIFGSRTGRSRSQKR